MSTDGKCTKWHRNSAEYFNRLSRVHERYRQKTDDRQTDGRWHIANWLNSCTLTSRWRLESYKRLVSVSSQNFKVLSRSREVSVSVSSFYVSCPSLVLVVCLTLLHYRYTGLGEGLWHMRRHGPVIVHWRPLAARTVTLIWARQLCRLTPPPSY